MATSSVSPTSVPPTAPASNSVTTTGAPSPITTSAQASSTAFPGTTSVSEIDKMRIQDLLAERAKLRDAIPDLLKYPGITLTAMLVFIFNTNYTASPIPDINRTLWFAEKMLGLMGFSMALLSGFLIKLNEMLGRLNSVSGKINDALKPFNQQIKDEEMLKFGRSMVWGTLICMLIASLMGWHYLEVREDASAEIVKKVAAAKSNNPPSVSPSPRAPTASPSAQPK